jgi:hypothetical protein
MFMELGFKKTAGFHENQPGPVSLDDCFFRKTNLHTVATVGFQPDFFTPASNQPRKPQLSF